ncbi:MAG TPA: glycan-binding surface protein [Cyclobacteriaceae bacterium]
MKSIDKILFLSVALVMAAIFTQCSDDDAGGSPRIRYVRVTEAASSDSLLVAAAQGQMVAIMGENLENTVEVWFNDQPSSLIKTFITNTSIITRVPADLPEVITNKLKLIFSNGDSLLYDFSVDISEPLVTRMKSEYVNTGDVATFYGDFFYEPLVVTFTGDVEAEILSVEDQVLEVIVPDGAQPGPVTIASNFGTTETDFWFRDNRNIFANFEGPFISGFWRGGDFVVDSDPDVSNISSKFMRVNKGQQGAWPYLEVYGGPADGDVATLTKVIPEGAFIDPGSYSLKFEVNTLESISGAIMRLYLGSADGGSFGDARNNIYYEWQANLDTKGAWETVTIPWANVYEANQEFPYNPSGYGMYIYFHGPNPAIYNFAMDNFRVVPNTND